MRKRHTAEFKAKVAIEAVKGLKTINEIAAHFEVAPIARLQNTRSGIYGCGLISFNATIEKKNQ